jgi:hypothetical protein
MNIDQARICAKLTDDEIVTLYPEVARRHIPVLREWARVGGNVEWKSHLSGAWHPSETPQFKSDHDYRIPVRRIEITGPGGTYSYPEPLRVAPALCTYVFIGDPTCVVLHAEEWKNYGDQLATLRRGLVHLTREAAEEHARAIILASGGSM